MAISDSQKVDLLYKKIAWSVAKTDTNPPKEAYNEANPSPLLIRGDTMWQQSGSIPASIPTTTSSIVQIYKDGSGSWSSTVECTELAVTDNRTWSTGLTNWIDPQFGATYFVKVYVDTVGSTTPQTTGTALQAAGLNDDQWYFDYQAGILNFIGTNLPTSIATGVTGKSVFISGARYVGAIGTTNFTSGLTLGNITINGNTITGNTGVSFAGNITTTGNLLTNGFFWANGNPVIFSNYGNANVALLLSGFGSNTISTTGNITGNIRTDYISTNLNSVTVFNSTGAITLPTGGNIARPASPAAGQLRYNSDFNLVEFYNGGGWVSVISNIDGEQFSGDGTNSVFTLKNGATQNGILVSINGTVQQPGYAYTVVGNQITFTEIPLTTDQIDIRYLAAAAAVDNNITSDLTVTGNILPGANVTYNLGSITSMWKSLYVSSNTIYIAGIPLSIAPGNVITVNGAPVTTYSNANVTSYLAAGTDTTINAITTAWQANAAIKDANIGAITNNVTTLFSNAATQATSINSINANVTAANAAIITANSAVVSYVNSLNSAMISNIIAANTAITTANSYNQTYTTNAVSTAINNLINSAPGTLDTLGEIAANLASQGSAVGAITNSITNTNANVTAANAVIATLAPISSPTFTGTPLAPTAGVATNNTQLATTAFVRSILPSGVIVMWSGSSATIPAGWYLCDGTNSTPNLKDRFVIGAGNAYAVGATGGSADAVVVSHNHTASSSTSTSITDPGHRHWISSAAYDDGNGSGTGANGQEYGLWADAGSYSANDPNKSTGRYNLSATTGITASSSTSTTVNSTGSSATGANLPPYYALCYIMKS